MRENINARLGLIATMVLFGTIPLFVRNIPISSATLALMRAVIAIVFLFALRVVRGNPLQFPKLGRDMGLLFLSGAMMGFNWIVLFEAYRYTTVAVATLLYYFAPVLVALGSLLFFGEKLRKVQILCLVGATAGLALTVGIDGLSGGLDPRGILFGIAAAVLYAGVILINTRIHSVSGTDRTFLQFIAAVIVLLPYLLLTEGLHLEALQGTGWLWLLTVGILHTGIAYCVYFSCLSKLRGQEVAILSYIDPLVAILIGATILREPTTVWQLLGGALILVSTLLNELLPNRD